jgi:hypothetical protein
MDLHVRQDELCGGIRRTARLSDVIGQRDVEIFFEMEGAAADPPAVLDGFVFGVIFYAMRLGQDLCVRGSLTRTAREWPAKSRRIEPWLRSSRR